MNSYEALQEMRGEDLGGTRYGSIYPNGIAVVDLIGPIYPRANAMTVSGATSIQQFTSDFVKAEAHADVKGVVIHIDSPGGDVRGIGDAAKVISAVSRQSKKPIQAFISGLGASAAYYIASAVGPGNLFASEMGMAGSIGVVLSGIAKQKGEIEIVSSQSPHKRPDLATDEGRAVIQERLDDLAGIFIKDVSKYRKVSQTKVLADYGQGKVYVAPRALKQGLIDGIGTLSQVVEDMGSSGSTGRSRQKASDETTVESLLMFTEEDENMPLKDVIDRFRASTESLIGAADDENDEQGQSPAVGADDSDAPAGVEAPVDVSGTDVADPATADAAPVGTPTAPATFTREELEDRFSDSAELFATQMTTDNRIFPAQAAYAASDLLTARIDDMLVGGTVNFVDESGQLAVGTREAAVRARYAAMPKHGMTQKAVAGVKDGSVVAKVLGETDKSKASEDDGPISEERRRQLMSLSTAGQAALNASK